MTSVRDDLALNELLTKHPLERDGIVDSLYHYLWSKDTEDEGLRVYIPDTIVYRNRIVEGWYFTSKTGPDAGMVKRKAKANTSNQTIEEAFIGKCPDGFDVVATYMENAEGPDGKPRPGPPLIEYFTAEQLRDFLYKRKKAFSGVLQRFIEPKGAYNCECLRYS